MMMVMMMMRMKRMVTIARERDANESVFTMDKGCGYVRKPASMTTDVADGHTDCLEARTHRCEGGGWEKLLPGLWLILRVQSDTLQ